MRSGDPQTTAGAATGMDASSPAGSTAPPTGGAPAGAPPPHKIHRTRVSVVWVSLTVAAVVLLALLIFILQNLQSEKISFLGLHGRIPLSVALLLAAVLGALVVAVPGTGRIVQLRRTAIRHRREETGA